MPEFNSADRPTEVIRNLPDLANPGGSAESDGANGSTAADAAGAGHRSRKGLFVTLGVLGGLIVAAVAAYLIDLGATSGEIERGTTIAGVEVGGMTPEQARTALEAKVRPQYEAATSVSAHGKKVSFDPASAGLTPNIEQAVTAAGTRSSSPLARIGSFFRDESVPLHVSVDDSKLGAFVKKIAKDTDVKAVEGSVKLAGTKVAVVQPVVGKHLDAAKATSDIATAWSSGGPQAVAGLSLTVKDEPVRVNAAGVAAAKAKAEAFLAGPVAVDAGGTALTIPVDQIAAATTIASDGKQGFTVAVDVAKVRVTLTPQILATELDPKDALVGLVGDAPQVTDGVTGRKVNWATSERALAAVLAKPTGRTWKVVYTTTEPDFTTKEAKALGLNEVIGEFYTGDFVYESGQNIKVIAEKTNGTIIQPGATFSINDFTGPRTAAEGYIEAGIIQEGAASKAVGGGISQFATTLYNASYFAGMTDVTHTPHSYYISRYPPGREATIFDGEIDLAFKNNFPTAVLIQAIWTDNRITVKLWGTKHVEVESVTGDQYNFTSAPEKTIPFGQECNPSDGTTGFSVDNTRIIRDLKGNEIDRQTQTTVYNGQFQVTCQPDPAVKTAPAAGTITGTEPPG